MRIPWDRRMKRLFQEAPQDLVAWLFSGAQFVNIVSPELEGEPLFTDVLFEVILNGQRFLLHIEFQKRRDASMAERLWEYNVRATLQYKLPVWSCVIYLKKDRVLENPFLVRALPNGQAVHRFDFEIIKLWEIPTRELKEKGLVGLLPLLVLTQDGARRDVVEEAIEGLTPSEEELKAELLSLTYGLASLAFEKEEDQEWLIRRFDMLHDILRETRAYQEMKKEGFEEGIQQGKLEALRQMLVKMVQTRFPNPRVIRQAKGQAAIIEDAEVLQDLIVKVSLAQTSDEVEQYLLNWPGPNEEQQ